MSREGADYEGRTGLAPTGETVTSFAYDANGNLTKDPSRDIVLIKYNHLNLPTDVYFGNGQRQTIEYYGNGVKKSVSYSQTTASIVGGNIPGDDQYSVTTKRIYAGPHIFSDKHLEYSAFAGGYFERGKGAYYYVQDWQGNNVGVVDSNGKMVESTTYYPYGEPTKEPAGQRFLYGGKEREHGGGRNSYDFSARNLIAPLGQWGVPDQLAEKYFSFSPYSYCGGDPINYIDPDGQRKWPVPEVYSGVAPRHSNDYKTIRKGSSHPHGGVDINIGSGDFDKGAPVYATHDGKVVRIATIHDDKNGGGNRVKIQSNNKKVETFYMHLEGISEGLKVGDFVEEGQQIGTVGGSGNGVEEHWEIHLHYEMFIDGQRVNPADKDGSLKDPQIISNDDNTIYNGGVLKAIECTAKHIRKIEEIQIDFGINKNPTFHLILHGQ